MGEEGLMGEDRLICVYRPSLEMFDPAFEAFMDDMAERGGWDNPAVIPTYADEPVRIRGHRYRADCAGLCCADVRAARGWLPLETELRRMAHACPLHHTPEED